MSGLSKQTTGLSIQESTALDALKSSWEAEGRHSMLTDIIEWLVDQAENADVDDAEWDAQVLRDVARDLAKRFA